MFYTQKQEEYQHLSSYIDRDVCGIQRKQSIFVSFNLFILVYSGILLTHTHTHTHKRIVANFSLSFLLLRAREVCCNSYKQRALMSSPCSFVMSFCQSLTRGNKNKYSPYKFNNDERKSS